MLCLIPPVTCSGLMGGASGESTLARPSSKTAPFCWSSSPRPPIACAVCTLLYCLPSSHAIRGQQMSAWLG